MHQCRFIGCSKYITLLVDVESRGGCEWGGGISAPSSQFGCEPITARKTQSLFKSPQISQRPSWEVRCHPCRSHPPSDRINTQDFRIPPSDYFPSLHPPTPTLLYPIAMTSIPFIPHLPKGKSDCLKAYTISLHLSLLLG